MAIKIICGIPTSYEQASHSITPFMVSIFTRRCPPTDANSMHATRELSEHDAKSPAVIRPNG